MTTLVYLRRSSFSSRMNLHYFSMYLDSCSRARLFNCSSSSFFCMSLNDILHTSELGGHTSFSLFPFSAHHLALVTSEKPLDDGWHFLSLLEVLPGYSSSRQSYFKCIMALRALFLRQTFIRVVRTFWTAPAGGTISWAPSTSQSSPRPARNLVLLPFDNYLYPLCHQSYLYCFLRAYHSA